MAQQLIVALLVGCCLVYALWTLAPKAPRSRVAQALLKWRLPAFVQKPLQAAARQQGGCGCDGCDHAVKPKAAIGPAVAPASVPTQPVHFVRTRHAGSKPRP